MSLHVGSSNYLKTSSITKADESAVSSVTSATAFICRADDDSRTALANSEITLSVVSGTIYAGTFPSTVPLSLGTDYLIVTTIVADGVKRIQQFKERATLG